VSNSFDSLSAFYRYYLSQHQNGVCRVLHVLGTSAVAVVFWAALFTAHYGWWLALPVLGYAPAWVGHFGFEKNKPATFGHPLKSFLCDWIMTKDILLGRVPLTGPLPKALIEPISQAS
jgi:hypothetical protein